LHGRVGQIDLKAARAKREQCIGNLAAQVVVACFSADAAPDYVEYFFHIFCGRPMKAKWDAVQELSKTSPPRRILLSILNYSPF